MSELTVENIFTQIISLPARERIKLRQLMDRWEQAGQKPSKPPIDKRAPPIPVPDSTREMQWITDHRREYAGQWVALDGDRLIAHSPNHDQVWAAAQADGAYLPMVVFIEDPDKIHIGFQNDYATIIHRRIPLQGRSFRNLSPGNTQAWRQSHSHFGESRHRR